VNFLGDDEPDAVRAVFGSNYARLVKLKTKVRSNQLLQPQPERGAYAVTARLYSYNFLRAQPRSGEGPKWYDFAEASDSDRPAMQRA
jgi:hypothetical protein